MLDLLRIHVLWAPGSDDGARVAELISRHFDGIGMERDGVAFRVPVRFAGVGWDEPSRLPAQPDLARAAYNAVVLLHDDYMHEHAAEWSRYVEVLRGRFEARGSLDCYVPFGSSDGDPPLAADTSVRIQYVRRDRWVDLPNEDARDQRLLLHLLLAIRRHLSARFGSGDGQPLFVSHAKADGDATARAIVDFVNGSGHDVPLETFYDATELNPGEDYEERFVTEIRRGTLLAIVSDVYDSRPWCVFELTTAKRLLRPIVLADVGGVRVSRTFPYGANLPRVRISPDSGDVSWIEPLLVELLSEGLRCDLFGEQARRVLHSLAASGMILPRPPELLDVAELAGAPPMIVHPDPPLGDLESAILRRALDAVSPSTRIVTLGELA